MTADPLTPLALRVGARLKAAGRLLVTAESCTGGWIAEAVTAIAGSSDWFERGYVTYSNAAKQESLGVRDDTLTRFGAVSEETAREMAVGALTASRASVAIAVTGVAGPSGGSAEKPVGMVCFAWAVRDRPPRSETCRFAGDRAEVRRQSVVRSLQGLIEVLDEAQAQD
ncbi:MAG: damage-inducible protein CinA [Betaproteobacteria bacterium SG8_39]|nr:MAG: damage-inducible protein CinA [Betaproteobacteria bacterium SG8_39]